MIDRSRYPRVPQISNLTEISFVRDALREMPDHYIKLLRFRGGEVSTPEQRRCIILLSQAGWVKWDCQDGFIRGIRYTVNSLVRYVMDYYSEEFYDDKDRYRLA